ncbi:Pollen ole e 1 allergen and extensin family protein [Thalictrum thalictroides]|uniref:Pollen ole e 1 allergen and extensin family protein n=1 Tax=Thalictrum thalictroides TaxID=46969 RepID=A0A7J6VZI0_THATH|nr:Pollen ole e 1 allergen and extensin family protein [Thalictrum thalictroides]
MALPWMITTALFLVLAFASIQSSTCHVVKGSVSCLDCAKHDDLSEVNVLVKCDKVKQFATTTTEKDGCFEAELNVDPSSTNCEAQLVGGPEQLWSYKKTLVSKIVKSLDSKSFTISTPLAFFTSCPSKSKLPSSPSDAKSTGASTSTLESSKTIDLPVPREWGLPPTSYYIPIIPIGIP